MKDIFEEIRKVRDSIYVERGKIKRLYLANSSDWFIKGRLMQITEDLKKIDKLVSLINHFVDVNKMVNSLNA